jgi:hypothetical protein
LLPTMPLKLAEKILFFGRMIAGLRASPLLLD